MAGPTLKDYVQQTRDLGRPPLCFVIHGARHLRAALTAGRESGRAVVAVSGAGASAYAGAGWFQAMVGDGRAAFPDVALTAILDCGDRAGDVMAAFQRGVTDIVFTGHPDAATRLRAIAAGFGARVHDRRPEGIDLINPEDPLFTARRAVEEAASVCQAGFFRYSGPTQTYSDIPAMKMTPRVRKILANYESDNPGTKANLARMLMQGRLAGTGKLVILPVDQGFEHGPARSFAPNPPAYDPHYHFQLAIDAGLSAYAAPLGMIEAGADTFAGQIPTILKLNSANSLSRLKEDADQAVTGSVADALKLGCSAIGFTIYPGSDAAYDQFEEIRELAEEAKSVGLAVVVWSYPRGGTLTKEAETAVDICAYAAHMAALLGAHIIKVKPPTAVVALDAAKKTYQTQAIPIGTMTERIRHVVQACFNGRRIVVFSGGEAKDLEALYAEIRELRDGGANGSIIGRNTFQRPREEALALLDQIIRIYLGQS
jgi:class I fructose-bisphosphate aldolase